MSTELAMHDEQFTQSQLDFIKRQFCPGSDDDLKLFVATAKRLRLDIYARQIHATFHNTQDYRTKQWSQKMSIIVSIDAYRLIAARTGEYEGQTKVEWYDADVQAWSDVWSGEPDQPHAARVGVYRKGFREPLVRTARYDAYVQTTRDGNPNHIWKKRGAEQLAKCAEALALRAAFPNELSGVYTPDEMDQTSNDDDARPKDSARSATAPVATGNATTARTSTMALTETGETSKPASVPPPAAAGDDGVVRFRKGSAWAYQPIAAAPTATVLEYIGALERALKDPKKQDKRVANVAHLRDVEAIYELMVTAEMDAAKLKERKDVDIGSKLQEAIDAKTPPDEGDDNWVAGDEHGAAP
jgi:phage recombination protein Bet